MHTHSPVLFHLANVVFHLVSVLFHFPCAILIEQQFSLYIFEWAIYTPHYYKINSNTLGHDFW